MDTEMKDYLLFYDFNLPLNDALADPTLSDDRRALAAVSKRQCLRDGLYSVTDLMQTFGELLDESRRGVLTDESPASERLNAILRDDGDDYQRRIYFIVSELPLQDGLADLEWLEEVMRGRFQMFALLRDAGATMPLLPGTGGVTMGTPTTPYQPYRD